MVQKFCYKKFYANFVLQYIGHFSPLTTTSMNKSQLISAVADTTGVSKSDVKRVFDALFELTEQKLNENEKVVVSGFGVFSTTQVAEREGRNPRTGEKVRIAARRVVRFRSNMEIR